MSLVRMHVACLAIMVLTATPAAAQSVEELLIAKLAAISLEADQRTAAFMREIAPRQASLRLTDLSTPENLVSREGRAAIRAGYLSFSKIIDDMDSFDRAEEIRVGKALSDATSGFPPKVALDAQAGFKRGFARTAARYAALRAVQRQSIRATLELVDIIERSVGGVSIAGGRLAFVDRETQLRVSHLFSELGRLEMEEETLEREIAERRSVPVESRLRQ